MKFNDMIAARPSTEQPRLLVQYVHELTIEARGVVEVKQLRGVVEAIHTIAGALLRGSSDRDFLVGDVLGDLGRIYGIDHNLQRAIERVQRRKPQL